VGLKNMTHKRLFILREGRYFEQLEAKYFFILQMFYTILQYSENFQIFHIFKSFHIFLIFYFPPFVMS
jgi:hypothetical protein